MVAIRNAADPPANRLLGLLTQGGRGVVPWRLYPLMATRTVHAANDGLRGVEWVQEIASGWMEVAMARLVVAICVFRSAIGF